VQAGRPSWYGEADGDGRQLDDRLAVDVHLVGAERGLLRGGLTGDAQREKNSEFF
jgi:hypothetical protein